MISESIEQISKTKEVEILSKFKGFSKPGANRQLSICNGLEAIRTYADDNDYVFIHDAARPLLSAKQITDCLEAANGHDGALPVLPIIFCKVFYEQTKQHGVVCSQNDVYGILIICPVASIIYSNHKLLNHDLKLRSLMFVGRET